MRRLTSRWKIIQMHAYTDESGNTGMNLFDDAQPWFWTVTLLAPRDLDPPAGSAIARWSAALSVPDIHGNALGLKRLEQIAWPVHAFLAEHDCQFIFTRLEKRHHSGLKFVDTLIDSGINPAVPGHVYGNRLLRLGLAHAIVSNFSPRNEEEWWEVYQTGDLDGFRRILRRVHFNVDRKVKDPRLRELAVDALEWALDHPEEFPELKLKRGEYDSPNYVAFTNVLDGLHKLCGDHAKIERFIHDEQNQFAKFMRTAFGLVKKWDFSTMPLAWMTEMAERDTFHCEIEFESRKNVPPLRLADLALWLLRRRVERDDDVPDDSAALLRWIGERSRYYEISRGQLAQSVIEGLIALSKLEITPEQEARGREIVARLERERRERLGRGCSSVRGRLTDSPSPSR